MASMAGLCVMCFRTAAAQQTARAQVLNSGIIVLLIPPILVLGLMLWMAARKKAMPVPPSDIIADGSDDTRNLS